MPERHRIGRMRRTWPQRLLIVLNSFAIIAALAAAGLVAYGKKTVSDIPRLAISGPGVQPVADLEPGAPQNFLIVGIDDDEGLAANDPIRDGRDNGNVTGKRSDVIMVVRVDPQTRQARILSIPRDLWVDLPGGGRNKINASFQYGQDNGPSNLIATLKQNFDIDVNHYVQVNFASFKEIVAQIDGVQVYLSNPVRDGFSRLDQPNAGCVTLDPDQALAYVRSRHLQYYDGGRWKGDPTSDFGRVSRQQDLVRRVIRRAFDRGATNPATLRRMIETALNGYIKIDGSTTPQDLITLGRTFRNYDPDELITYSLPVVDATHSGAAALDLIPAQAQPIIDLFKGTGSAGGTAEDVAPSSVTLRVLNGTGKQNQGTDTSNELGDRGFQVRAPGNDTSTQYDRTEVHYRADQQAAAVLVARYLTGSPVLIEDDTYDELTVITGNDLFGTSPAPRPVDEIVVPTTTTTTTTTTTPTFGSDSSGDSPAATTTIPKADPGIVAPAPEGYLPGTPPDGTSCG